MSKCYNKNAVEYKALQEIYKDDVMVDSIINKWQSFKKSNLFPSVEEAKSFLKDIETTSDIRVKDFGGMLLKNLSLKNLISWSDKYKVYFVNNTTGSERKGNKASLDKNINAIVNFLNNYNIPLSSIDLTDTKKSAIISVNYNAIKPTDVLTKQKIKANNHTVDILNHLKKLFPNVNIQIKSVEDAKTFYDSIPEQQKKKIPFSQVKSFYINGQAILIKGRVTNETAIEEVMHPFIDALYQTNRSVFDKLLKESKKTFPLLAQEIENSYNSSYKKFSQKERDLELVTQALTRHFNKTYEEEPTKSFKDVVLNALEWFLNIVRDLYSFKTREDGVSELEPKELKSTTTLSSLAKLLNTKDLEFVFEIVKDNKVKYALSKEKQTFLNKLKSRGATDSQILIMDRMFHQASSIKDEVEGLPANAKFETETDIVVLNEADHTYHNLNKLSQKYMSTTTAISGKMENLDDVALNLAVGNDFDNIVEGIALFKTFDELKSQMEILNEEQALRAYNNLQGYVEGLRSSGDIVVPQVIAHYTNPDGVSIAGAIDILIITPEGKFKIVDIKTSKNKYATSQDGKYNKEWDIKNDSLLKPYGVERLSTKQKHNIQVNIYRRMLENMGYEFVNNEFAVSTFHIWVDITGEKKNQKFNGNFEIEMPVAHPINQNKPYVDAIVPVDVSLANKEFKKSLVGKPEDNILESQEALDAFKATREGEEEFDKEQYQEDMDFETIDMSLYLNPLRTYRENLITRKNAIDAIKSSVYMDRSKEEAIERISTSIAMISIALESSDKEVIKTFTYLLQDIKKELDSYEKYLLDVKNAQDSNYITRARNYENFAKTFEGLYKINDAELLNTTQKNLILAIQSTLTRLSVSTPDKLSVVDEAIINHVKGVVRNKSNRDFTPYKDPITGEMVDPFEKLFKEAMDIGIVDYLTRDTDTSSDTLLAIMKKLWKAENQKVLDAVDKRDRFMSLLGSKLVKLSPGKTMKEIFSYMIVLDEKGNHTGRYVQAIGNKYYDKLEALKVELYDENNNWKEYKEIEDINEADPEDLEFNKKLFKARNKYYEFLNAETIGPNKERTSGEYHEYTQEFIDIRSQYQDFIPAGKNGYWVFKIGISKQEQEKFHSKYFNAVPVKSPIIIDDVFTGKMINSGIVRHFPRKEYRVIKEISSKGEDMRSEKYKEIMEPKTLDALAIAKKDFYLGYMKTFTESLDMLGDKAGNMLGKTPRIAGKLAKEVKLNSDGAKTLWSNSVRKIKEFTQTTTRLSAVNTDENGNIVRGIPIMYTGSLRDDASIKLIEDEIKELKEKYANSKYASSESYNAKLMALNSKLASLRSKPAAEELSFDLVGTILKFSAMAENYHVMSAIEDTMLAFQKVIEKRQYKEYVSPIKSMARKISGKDDLFSQKRKNVKNRAEKFLEMVFYEESDVTKGMYDKAIDKLLSYTSLSYVAFNVFGNFNNYMLGRLNNGIEMMGQRFFSRDAYIRASKEFNTRAVQDLIHRTSYKINKASLRGKGKFDPYEPMSKYEAFVDYLRMMDDPNDIREQGGVDDTVKGKSYVKRVIGFGYSFQEAAEYNVQSKVGMAMVIDTYILNENTGEVLSLYDAFEFTGNQKLKLKSGFTTIVKPKKNIPTFKQMLKGSQIKKDESGNMLYDIVGEFNNDFRYNLHNNIREVNKQIHGNYAAADKMVIQLYTMGKLVAQFHKWVAPAIRARYQHEYFDENLGWMEGRYRSYLQFVKYIFKNLSSIKKQKEGLIEGFMKTYDFKGDGSQADERILNKVYNIHRTNAEMAMILMMYLTVKLLSGIWSDDDDNETIRRLKNIAKYNADRGLSELSLFTPTLAGGKQMLNFFESPFAITGMLGQLGGALSSSIDYSINGAMYLATGDREVWFDNKEVYYQRGTRTGKLKVAKETADVVPVWYEIQKWVDFLNTDKFYIGS